MGGSHTSRAYEAELRELKGRLLAMGARCESQIRMASQAMLDLDVALARNVERHERTLNTDEMAIDRMTHDVLALRQPVGRDLRFLITALKVVTDLERIGDESVNVAERTAELAAAGAVPQLRPRIGVMAESAAGLVHRALDSFVEEDEALARSVLRDDDAVDAMYGEILRAAVEHMKASPDHVEDGMRVASCAKYLERIADHATNISEMVVFMVSGEDVRHYSDAHRADAQANDGRSSSPDGDQPKQTPVPR